MCGAPPTSSASSLPTSAAARRTRTRGRGSARPHPAADELAAARACCPPADLWWTPLARSSTGGLCSPSRARATPPTQMSGRAKTRMRASAGVHRLCERDAEALWVNGCVHGVV
eukprot:3297251-Pleurochrysis_carterae.AAC.1